MLISRWKYKQLDVAVKNVMLIVLSYAPVYSDIIPHVVSELNPYFDSRGESSNLRYRIIVNTFAALLIIESSYSTTVASLTLVM
ncbi:hypothetical protein EWB00_006238 [Schistosoma japonicum]|uniref:Uncharacterized protein n=1 Tax=Schistosoma japonicum TaxID=6182 RepID=A0A4Z2CZ97_SCHJA|nr:hypothetical protein EWB00_006238 [Schistosoma japonicum]